MKKTLQKTFFMAFVIIYGMSINAQCSPKGRIIIDYWYDASKKTRSALKKRRKIKTVAKQIQAFLQNNGYKPIIMKSTHNNIKPQQRIELAQQLKAAITLALSAQADNNKIALRLINSKPTNKIFKKTMYDALKMFLLEY